MPQKIHELQGKTIKQWASQLGISVKALQQRVAHNGGVFDESCLQRKPYFVRGVKGGKHQQTITSRRLGNQFRLGHRNRLKNLTKLAERVGENAKST